jgi:aspartyl-tRNA(Asn)/glutamyl-tRNA(Gln) amidotransferase subunit A
LIRQDFHEAFKEVDLIATPVTPTPAFKLGEKSENPLQMYLSDIYTISVNLAGLPAISVPCGFSKGGLPIGLQLIGRAFEEETLLRAAHAYEQSTQWHLKKPVVR